MRVHTMVSLADEARAGATITDIATVRGGGPSLSASPARPKAPASPEPSPTPAPPNEAHLYIPSAAPADIPKKIPEKIVTTLERNCGTCYNSVWAVPHLTCHANSPKPSSSTPLVIWPIVKSTDWCGDWRDRVEMLAYLANNLP